MRFTVCTVTKNRPEQLERCMNSVRNQSFPDWQQIIVDGSDSPVRLRDHEPRVRRLVRAPHGITDALVCALSHAEGEIVVCVHDDDELTRGALALVNAVLAPNSTADWLCARTRWLDDQGDIMFERGGTEHDLQETLGGTMMMGAAVFWRRGFAEKAGGIDGRFDAAHDFDLYRRMARCSWPVLVPTVLYVYHDHAGTYSQLNRERQRDQVREIAALT